MKTIPKKVIKHGVKVWSNEEIDLLRGAECLCLNCSRLNQSCQVSPILFEICKSFNLALLITRCPDWKE